MHHRAPTSSNNKLSQTHPLIVDNGSLKYKYAFVHNGIISNAEDVKKAHEKLGFEYLTEYKQEWSNAEPDIKFNDSESLAIELARYIEKQTDTIATSGSIAFIGIQINRKTNKVLKVFFGRNTSPLNLSASRGKIRLSSEGKGNAILANTLYTFEPNNYKLEKTKFNLPETKYTYNETTTPSRLGYSTTKIKDMRDYNYEENYYNQEYDEKIDTYNKTEKLEAIMEETIIDGQAIIDVCLSDIIDKIASPTEILLTDIEEEIKETVKNIIITMRDMYKQNYKLTVEATYEDAADETKETINQNNKETNVNNKKANEENSKKNDIEIKNKTKENSKIKTIANQECFIG